MNIRRQIFEPLVMSHLDMFVQIKNVLENPLLTERERAEVLLTLEQVTDSANRLADALERRMIDEVIESDIVKKILSD